MRIHKRIAESVRIRPGYSRPVDFGRARRAAGTWQLTNLVDTTDLMPAESVNFYDVGWDVSLEEDRVAFAGTSSSVVGGPVGVYSYDDSEGGFTLIANQDTPIPGGIGGFQSFGTPSLDGENPAFTGMGPDLSESLR